MRRVKKFSLLATLLLALAPWHSRAANSSAGWALSCDGVDDFVTVPHRSELNVLPLTITAWINTTQATGSKVIVSKANGVSATGSYRLFIVNGESRAAYSRDPSNFVAVRDNGGFVADGYWHQLAFVVETNGASLLVDGNLRDSEPWQGAVGPPMTTQDVRFGLSPGNLTNVYQGLIDEVALWKVARTQADLQAGLYQPLSGSEPGLLAYWPIKEGSGATIADATANHFDGFLTNGPTWVRSCVPAFGGALLFDGNDAYLRIPNFGRGTPTNEITVEFWLNVSGVKDQILFSLDPDNPQNRLSARVPSGDGSVQWDFGNSAAGGHLAYQPPVPIIATWQHFALVASQSSGCMQIYRNGQLEASTNSSSTLAQNSYDLLLGGINGAFTAGQVDEFRIWSLARTQTEIQQNLHRHLTGAEPGLAAYFRFRRTGRSPRS